MIMTEAPLELEGTWEEILSHAPDLEGKHIRLTAMDEPSAPNDAFLAAMERVEEIWRGKGTTPAGDTNALIREARAGAMYGLDTVE
jgi:hypothetical protein